MMRPAAALVIAAMCLAFSTGLILGQPTQEPGLPDFDNADETAEPSGWPKVLIAVRVDAMPFAWRDPRPEQARIQQNAQQDAQQASDSHRVFRGFLVELCNQAAIHAGFSPELVAITASQRSAFLNNFTPSNWKTQTSSDSYPAFDVLCDPTTISLSRMYRIHEGEDYVFSPILFVANSSFVRAGRKASQGAIEPPAEDCIQVTAGVSDKVVAGFVVGTTAERAFSAARERRALGGNFGQYCSKTYDSHQQGMEDICAGKIGAYFGDIDIIRAYQREIASQPGGDCPLEYTRDFLIYEPYALLVGRGKREFRAKFMRELYRLFSDGTVEDAYRRHFPDQRPSAALSMLFRINGVPMGQLPAPDGNGQDPAGDTPDGNEQQREEQTPENSALSKPGPAEERTSAE
jgi:ABC-type amino acid transport substrate-binding protein